ncbi:MAG: hypothetical protein NTZ78_04570 [Candidatus Aureabacteria bacterium]|nr:hypothetical protein [Candidatus Auribacterota bacterium]
MPAKKITFAQPKDLHTERDGIEILFPFSLVDASLVGTPEEESETINHKIIVGASGTLTSCWGLNGGDLLKVLFEYGKRHVVEKIRDGTLGKKEEIVLTTGNTPYPCRFDASKIDKPERASYTVELPLKPIMEGNIEIAAAIIDTRDNINALFKERFKEPLLVLNQERDILQLFRSADSQEEFFFRICALANLVQNLNVKVLRGITGISDTTMGSISLIEEWLKKIGAPSDSIIPILRNLNCLRKGYPVHGDHIPGVVDAHRYLDIAYPPDNFPKAWHMLLNKYFEALRKLLDVLRPGRK